MNQPSSEFSSSEQVCMFSCAQKLPKCIKARASDVMCRRCRRRSFVTASDYLHACNFQSALQYTHDFMLAPVLRGGLVLMTAAC